MVLIITNSKEASTTHVIEWLEFYKIKWKRINEEEKVKLSFIQNDIKIETDDFSIKLSEVKSHWYRRGFINNPILESESEHPINEIKLFIKNEHFHLKQYFYYLLNKKKQLIAI